MKKRDREDLEHAGVLRKVDVMGRVSIPSFVRKKIDLQAGDPIDIYYYAGSVLIRKHRNHREVLEQMEDIKMTLNEKGLFDESEREELELMLQEMMRDLRGYV